MNLSETVWIQVRSNEIGRLWMQLNKSGQNATNLNTFNCTGMKSCGNVLKSNLSESVWIWIHSKQGEWISVISYENAWISMNLYKPVWILIDNESEQDLANLSQIEQICSWLIESERDMVTLIESQWCWVSLYVSEELRVGEFDRTWMSLGNLSQTQ